MEHTFEIHLGEAQAIILTRERGALLLIDESSGRTFAETLDLKVRGTLYVIMKALREELLDRTEAEEVVLALVGKGFRIVPKLLARILREMDTPNTHDYSNAFHDIYSGYKKSVRLPQLSAILFDSQFVWNMHFAFCGFLNLLRWKSEHIMTSFLGHESNHATRMWSHVRRSVRSSFKT
jgi:hypothetical protein